MTTELHGGCTLTLACELVDAEILDGASVKAALEEAAHVYGLDYDVLRDECEQRGIIEEPIPTTGRSRLNVDTATSD